MVKLTKRSIDTFRYAGGWDVRWDDVVPGFGVRVYASGKRAFVLSYRAKGRKRLMVLGRFGADLTLDQARTKAAKLLSQVRDGTDPLEEKARAKVGKTLADLIKRYLAHQKAHGNKTWGDDEKRLNRHIPPRWRARKAEDIEPHEIAKLHGDLGARAPYEANRLLSCLHHMFVLAPGFRIMTKDGPNPAAGIQKFKERKRRRWASPEEVRALGHAIDEEPSLYVRHALWLYLLTGVRKSELLRARRLDIDWSAARLKLPVTKADEEQSVPLNALALEILRRTPAEERNPYLLPGTKKGAHLVNIEKPWRKVRRRATVRLWTESPDPSISGLVVDLAEILGRDPTYEECEAAAEFDLPVGVSDLRLHDLRRTVGSWMSQSAVDLNTIRETLRHASISTTLTYARLGADQARDAMEAHGRRIMDVAGGPRLVESGGENR